MRFRPLVMGICMLEVAVGCTPSSFAAGSLPRPVDASAGASESYQARRSDDRFRAVDSTASRSQPHHDDYYGDDRAMDPVILLAAVLSAVVLVAAMIGIGRLLAQ